MSYDFLQLTAEDAMARKPVCVGPEASIEECQRLFERHGFNGMPVVGDDGRMVGFVTKLDVLRAFCLTPARMVPPYGEIMTWPVERIMTRAPVSVPRDYPLTRVLQRLVEMGVKSLPVTDGEQVVGIVAREDVLEALKRSNE